jgi:hypothetical protein
MQDATGALLQAASGSHLGAVTWIRSHDYHGNARTYHGLRLSRRKPSAAGGTRASHTHGTRKMLACSQAHVKLVGRGRSELESRVMCAHLDVRLHPNVQRWYAFFLRARQARTNARDGARLKLHGPVSFAA